MAIPHGDPEKFYNHMCLFSLKDVFHGDNMRCQTRLFIAISQKDSALQNK